MSHNNRSSIDKKKFNRLRTSTTNYFEVASNLYNFEVASSYPITPSTSYALYTYFEVVQIEDSVGRLFFGETVFEKYCFSPSQIGFSNVNKQTKAKQEYSQIHSSLHLLMMMTTRILIISKRILIGTGTTGTMMRVPIPVYLFFDDPEESCDRLGGSFLH